MKKFILSPRFILPTIILFGVTIMGLRAADMWDMVSSGRLETHNAARAEDAPAKSEAPKETAKDMSKDAPAQASAPVDGEPAINLPPPDADSSPAEMEVLKQLGARREQLEKRSRDLDTREALLKVTEQRVDQKIKEMEQLRQQLQGMVNTANEAQQAQLDNLVKIYETMKPDDAATIFNNLDMPVLLGVIQHMKPKSTAPIMAKMKPEKAKEVTVALTKQDQLPQPK